MPAKVLTQSEIPTSKVIEKQTMSDAPMIIHEPDPDNPGWMTWDVRDDRRFNAVAIGKMIVRKTGDNTATVRMFPTIAHSNLLDKVHGGVTLAFVDVALFAAAGVTGHFDAPGSVTVSLDTQFIGAGDLDIPLDAKVDIIRATRRLIFLRGLVVQGDNDIASFSAIIRRATGNNPNVTAG